jgi:hypothetical protein
MELNFDTGVVEYDINGAYKVRFNPTDKTFIQRLSDAFDTLEAKQKSLDDEAARTGDKKEVFRIVAQRDAEVRAILDDLFGEGMCDAVFSDMSMHALAGGLPVWVNFVLAIMDECDSAFIKEKKLRDPRLAKYTKKYHK